MKLRKASLALILPLSLAWACGSTSGGDDGSGATSSGASAGTLSIAGDAASGGDGTGTSGGTTGSGGTVNGKGGTKATGGTTNTFGGNTPIGDTACSDGKDNDGDGLIDGLDPECTGPWDNDEGTFATGIPGDNVDPKWQDCFFDGNSGAGDDGCRYSTKCLTGELALTDKDCTLTASCLKFCAPLTPNGCDCFGCCTVQGADGNPVDVIEASTCSSTSSTTPRLVRAAPRMTLAATPVGPVSSAPARPSQICRPSALRPALVEHPAPALEGPEAPVPLVGPATPATVASKSAVTACRLVASTNIARSAAASLARRAEPVTAGRPQTRVLRPLARTPVLRLVVTAKWRLRGRTR